jgi:ATP-dependent RNA helicase DDX3X
LQGLTSDVPGSGKTSAYLIPILNNLVGKARKLAAPRPEPGLVENGGHPGVLAEPLVVIVCPTRELAIQIFNEARKFCYRTMFRPAVVYGGGPIRQQIDQLKNGCDILIATPGRMVDLMERGRHLTLRRVKYMVIDEADEMLTEDWSERLNMILSGGGKFNTILVTL